jgi:hypothetical protein
VRQGDPLSPSLFVIVMEALSRMIAAAIDNGRLSGFLVGLRLSELVDISHLLFADDTMVFCGVNSDHIQSIHALFVCFEAVSGLKVKMAKFVLVLVGTVGSVGDWASILGCGTDSLPLKYLGLPLGACYEAKSIWDDIVEKIECRLASLKMIYLSKGGRDILIKSTLSNLRTYFLSFFPILVSVANHIEKLQRDILWGGIGAEFKYHLVSWSKICSPIYEGGLGIRNLQVFNKALVGKWLWRYANERVA